MTNNDVSHDVGHDDQVRVALGRYQRRFQPAEADWAAIEARHRAAQGRRQRRESWWNFKLTTIAIAVPALAVVVIVVNFAQITINFGQSRAQAKSAPGAPVYGPVASRPASGASPTMATILARGYIRVGVKIDQPGFGFKDPVTGAWTGFDIEIAKLMAAGIFGVDVSSLVNKIMFVPVVSAEREADLASGKVDIVIATYTITTDRGKLVDFVGPYFRAQQDIMVKADDNAIKTVADLNGKKVCTVGASTSYRNLLTAAPDAQVTLQDTYSACARQLAAGRVEAVTTDNVILAGLVHENGFIFKVVGSPFSDEPYGIGLKKGDAPFRGFLTDRLAAVEANGDWALAESYALQGIQSFTPPPITR